MLAKHVHATYYFYFNDARPIQLILKDALFTYFLFVMLHNVSLTMI